MIADETWVLTGAAGAIGSHLRTALADRVATLRLADRVPVAAARDNERAVMFDLRDEAAVSDAVAGADGVVHLGGIADEAPLPELLQTNILGTYHVLEAARRHDVKRVVCASTNRVTGMYPADTLVSPEMPTRPDGFYAASKVAVEALGSMYADKFGLTVTSLRIATFTPEPRDARELATWLSPGDCTAAVLAAMHRSGRGHAVFYAVSRNRRRWWDLEAGRRLGFEPHDDAEDFRAALEPVEDIAPDAPQSGTLARPEHTLPHLRP